MNETAWWRLACKEFILDLYDEHVILRRKASIHNTRLAAFIPSEWRKRFENLGTTNETHATSVKSFVRQFVKHTFIRRCFLRPQNLSGSSSDIIFYSHIPKVWSKREIIGFLIRTRSLITVQNICVKQ